MTSKQGAKLIGGHADGGKDATQGAFGDVLTCVDWHYDCAAIGVTHHVMTTTDSGEHKSSALQRLDHLRSRYRRDATRHKEATYQKSGDIECQRQFLRWPDFIEQNFHGRPEVGDCGFLCRPVAECGHAWAELGSGAPDAVLILLDDVRHVHYTSHVAHHRIMRQLTDVSKCNLHDGF